MVQPTSTNAISLLGVPTTVSTHHIGCLTKDSTRRETPHIEWARLAEDNQWRIARGKPRTCEGIGTADSAAEIHCRMSQIQYTCIKDAMGKGARHHEITTDFSIATSLSIFRLSSTLVHFSLPDPDCLFATYR